MTAVPVTQEDIDNGKRSDAHECPLALALLRVLPEGTRVSVGVFTARINDTSLIDLPRVTERWTAAYDMGGQVSPVTFELDLGEFL